MHCQNTTYDLVRLAYCQYLGLFINMPKSFHHPTAAPKRFLHIVIVKSFCIFWECAAIVMFQLKGNKYTQNIVCLRKISYNPLPSPSPHPSSRIGQVWAVIMTSAELGRSSALPGPLLVLRSQNRSVPFGNAQISRTISWISRFIWSRSHNTSTWQININRTRTFFVFITLNTWMEKINLFSTTLKSLAVV